MDADELRELKNVLNYDFGVNTIFCILKKLGAFERDINYSTSAKEDYLTLGKRMKGAWLLDCIYKADKDKYMVILEKKEKE